MINKIKENKEFSLTVTLVMLLLISYNEYSALASLIIMLGFNFIVIEPNKVLSDSLRRFALKIL